MKDLINTALAKGIFYNKKTGLCIFETNQDKINWYNIHIDNIEGKFYKGCHAMLYQNDDDILKAVILELNKKKNKLKKFSLLCDLLCSITKWTIKNNQ